MEARHVPPAGAPLFQVFLRLRPSSAESSVLESRFLSTAPGHAHVYATPPVGNRVRAVEKFAFTQIFDESSEQLDVFRAAVLPLVRDVVRGRDGMLATLGVTGSGKTHTVLGSKHQRGMTQLALAVLFSSVGDRMLDLSKVELGESDPSDALVMDAPTFHQRMKAALDGQPSKRSSLAHATPGVPDVGDVRVDTDAKARYAVVVSMYELYNDRIFDLLDETPIFSPAARRKALAFRKAGAQSARDAATEQRKVVAGLRKVCAGSLAEALLVVEHGQACRRMGPTSSNAASSRSHAFLQIELKRFSPRGTERGSACLSIVDLAGSERARTAQTAGDRLAEAGSINRSLMCLGQCLQLQTQVNENGRPAVVPWRQSKLTELLFSNSFSGAAAQKASMIITADAMGDFNATTQILRYSALAREITVPRPASRQCSALSDSSLSRPPPSVIEDGDMISGEAGKDALIARLIAQIEETESRWRDAEERCLLIEQTVREEMATEMDERLEEIRRDVAAARLDEEEYRGEYVDGKLEIMKRGLDVQVYEDTPPDAAERIDGLERENDRLRNELATLRREVNNGSPTKQPRTAKKPLIDVRNFSKEL